MDRHGDGAGTSDRTPEPQAVAAGGVGDDLPGVQRAGRRRGLAPGRRDRRAPRRAAPAVRASWLGRPRAATGLDAGEQLSGARPARRGPRRHPRRRWPAARRAAASTAPTRPAPITPTRTTGARAIKQGEEFTAVPVLQGYRTYAIRLTRSLLWCYPLMTSELAAVQFVHDRPRSRRGYGAFRECAGATGGLPRP